MIPELRPRGIGEILDAAVSLYRARFGLLVRYAALVVVPVQLFLTIVLLSAQPDRFSVTVNGNATPEFDTGRAQLGATVVVLLVGWLTNAFVEAVTARIVAGAYVESGEAGGEAARAAVRRIPAVIAVALLDRAVRSGRPVRVRRGRLRRASVLRGRDPGGHPRTEVRVRVDGPLDRAHAHRTSGTCSGW